MGPDIGRSKLSEIGPKIASRSVNETRKNNEAVHLVDHLTSVSALKDNFPSPFQTVTPPSREEINAVLCLDHAI